MLANLVFDLPGEIGIFTQKFARIVAPLADFFSAVRIPGPCFIDDFCLHAQVDDLTQPADAFAIEDVKRRILERRGHLVLNNLDLGFVPDDFVTLLDAADTADINAHRGVELESVAAGSGFGAAEHDADLHANLVDEDHHAVGFLDGRSEFAQRLAHQPRLQAGQAVAHVPFDFGLGGERGDRVDHDQVDRAGTHQGIDDFQRLFTRIGLADEQVL